MAAQDTPDRGQAVTDVRAHLPRHLWFPSPEEQAFIAPWNGPGVQKDHGAAEQAYRRAAEQGNPIARLFLNHRYPPRAE